jgi:hypothetical protein
MVQGPPSSDSESEAPENSQLYHYESEGEETLGNRARALFHEAGGDYRRK